MKVLAILQNQWFKNPDRAQAIYDRHAGNLDRRAQLNRAYLFMGSLTGKRLRRAFGAMCDPDGIVWEEASPMKAGVSSGCFPPDAEHITNIIDHHKPEVVIAFGKVALDGLESYLASLHGRAPFKTVVASHPAARHDRVIPELEAAASRVRVLCER